MRTGLWRLLGGAVDEQGRPAASPDDWRAVFEGAPSDAAGATDALRFEGLESTSHSYFPARFYGQPEPTRTIVYVRTPDADRAAALIESLPHLGNLLAAASAYRANRPKGAAALVELATPAETDAAAIALHAAGIAAWVTEPHPDGLDDVGYIVSVRIVDLYEATEVIRALAAADETGSFRPRDLAEVEPPPTRRERSGIDRLPVIGWMFVAVMAGFASVLGVVFGAGTLAEGSPIGLFWVIVGVGFGWAARRAGRRSAELDRMT